jgi:TolA-binding protein
MSADASSRLRALGAQLAREQDEILARHAGPAVLRPARRGKPERARWTLPAAAAAAVALVVGGVWMARPRSLELTIAGEPAAAGAWIAAPAGSPVPIRFSDGTDVRLDAGGQARVLDVSARGAQLMLESGTAVLSVVPKPRAHWTVSAGPYTVEVKGTRFEIGWNPQDELLTLTLTEGRVAISGCALGEARLLYAGEILRASCRENDFQITRPAPAPPATAAFAGVAAPSAAPTSAAMPGRATLPGEPSPASPRSGAARSTGPGPGSWQALARASKFKEAFDLANEGGLDSEIEHSSVPDLLLLGDAARLSGNSGPALRAYQKVRSRAPGTTVAANAAFAMGRVYFDQLDAFSEAARWFASYSSEQPGGPLAREALGRRMEALSRAGARSDAARAAEQYLRQYPDGPHAPLARTLENGGN